MQQDLFSSGTQLKKMVRRNASETSVEAAKSVLRHVSELQQKVLDYAKTCENGFTDEEMNFHFQTHRSTYRARRSELVEMGLIFNSNEKRIMTNGRMATIWRAIKE